jgi:hypothetical protein
MRTAVAQISSAHRGSRPTSEHWGISTVKIRVDPYKRSHAAVAVDANAFGVRTQRSLRTATSHYTESTRRAMLDRCPQPPGDLI